MQANLRSCWLHIPHCWKSHALAQLCSSDGSLQTTLDRMRAGNYTTRPQWEDVYTSLAKPKPGQEQKVKTMVRAFFMASAHLTLFLLAVTFVFF